ncbi:MAG: protein translocase subunit SecF [Planctomycetes bacterium]|nr:protein translocase subunit SecF [Planctomycetota bacterium]
MCMFTAIYCSRPVFEIGERTRWLRDLRMRNFVGHPTLDFMGKERLCAAGSLILIIVGLIAAVSRGSRLFDVDINGGVSVVMQLEKADTDANVRKKLEEAFRDLKVDASQAEFTLNQMVVEGEPAGTIWKVDSSFQDVDPLKEELARQFDLVTYTMDLGSPTAFVETESSPADNPSGSSPTGESPPATNPTEPSKGPTSSDSGRFDDRIGSIGADTLCQETEDAADATATGNQPPAEAPKPAEGPPPADAPKPAEGQPPADAPKSAEGQPPTEAPKPAEGQPPAEAPKPTETPAPRPNAAEPSQGAANAQGEPTPVAARPAAKTTVQFGRVIEEDTLRRLLDDVIASRQMGAVTIQLTPKTVDESGRHASEAWDIVMDVPVDSMRAVLEQVRQQIEAMPVWVSASVIGGQVAGDTREKAIAAMIFSMIGIVAYVWIRFQRVVFGLAAVLALIHDVLITLSAIGISHYLFGIGSILLIDEFKISLPVVAAFLTLVGYSINDTIVVFDRIREVRGKNPNLTRDMLNLSINQTLSRTLLTSGTTLLVIVILYFLGGDGVHAFAFTLLVGITVGTYSSIYIASPALLWMAKWEARSNRLAAGKS